MEHLDFCSFIGIIRKYISDDLAPSQVDLLYSLFENFSVDRSFIFDHGLTCRWFTGQAKTSPQITEYYNKSSNRKKLKEDIENHILPLIYDLAMTEQEIYELVIGDTGISESAKKRLIKKYPCKNESESAEFLSEVLFFALERNFIKRDPKTKSVPNKNTSPDTADYIFGCGVPKPCKNFCGREKEIESLHELLCKNGKVFLHGIPGIGKSETAKAYAAKYKKEYTNILYIAYSGNLKQDIAEMIFADDVSGENIDERFSRHSRFLKTLKSDSLLIIDNFDTTPALEKSFSAVLKFGCRILFTTRSRFDFQKCFRLEEIEDPTVLFELMGKYYSEAEKHRETLGKIILTVHSHTLAAELSARLLENGILEPEELFEKLSAEKSAIDSSDKIKITKDGENKKATYYEHIHTLFSLYDLSKEENRVMRNLVFVPSSGISGKLFARWISLENMNAVSDLIEKGFIQSGTEQSIFLHPMIQEVALLETKPSVKNCMTLLNNLQDICLHHGETVPYYSLMFRTIENIVNFIIDDDTEKLLRFTEDVFPYMGCYDYKSGMKFILSKMEALLNDPSVGTVSDRSLLHDFRASLEDNIRNAIKEEEKAYSLISAINEGNALLAANICSNLGGLYKLSGKYIKAKEFMERGLEIMEKYHLVYHDIVPQLANYASLLVDMGDFETGTVTFEKLLKIVKKHGAYQTLGCAEIMRSLGMLYYMKCDFDTGMNYYKKSLKIYEDIFKDEPERAEKYKNEILNDHSDIGALLGLACRRVLKKSK